MPNQFYTKSNLGMNVNPSDVKAQMFIFAVASVIVVIEYLNVSRVDETLHSQFTVNGFHKRGQGFGILS